MEYLYDNCWSVCMINYWSVCMITGGVLPYKMNLYTDYSWIEPGRWISRWETDYRAEIQNKIILTWILSILGFSPAYGRLESMSNLFYKILKDLVFPFKLNFVQAILISFVRTQFLCLFFIGIQTARLRK